MRVRGMGEGEGGREWGKGREKRSERVEWLSVKKNIEEGGIKMRGEREGERVK